MKTLVLVSVLIAAEAARLLPLQNEYGQSSSSFNQGSNNFGQSSTLLSSSRIINSGNTDSFSNFGNSNSFSSLGNSNSFSTSFSSQGSCGNGQVRHVDGQCHTPEVRRNFYSYRIPEQQQSRGPAPILPTPKVEHNVLFVHLPENAGAQDPIVIPPPRQENVLFLLNKKTDQGGQRVIDLGNQPQSKPEVFFVNYNPGENRALPGGIDLQTALNNANQGTGTVIGGSSSSSGFGGFSDGFSSQSSSGFSGGFGDQFNSGFSSGFDSGFGSSTSGFSSGFDSGFGSSTSGFSNGFDSGFGSSNSGFSSFGDQPTIIGESLIIGDSFVDNNNNYSF